ncbi:uncharacterized protein LOC111328221 [Stylophora pistillata]|uniref:uncharacterized protein LOC111328221 n=1 Tax=Stylophora pistillata TaxID=50429 RepID=UPI000C053047|nr:uncharacterized protein LOC111328221 [Stylophora pistillata]
MDSVCRENGWTENLGSCHVVENFSIETESGPLSASLHETRTNQILKVLQYLGLVEGGRWRKFGRVFILVIVVLTWIPPTFLAICVKKDPTMSSPSGLPTILLLSGLALSHHFGALYGYKHRIRLKGNIRLAIERANFCRTWLIVIMTFAMLTLSYLILLVYLYVTQSIRPLPWLHIGCIYLLGYIYCGSISVAMNLVFSASCAAIKIRIIDFKEKFKNWSKGLREALIEYQELCEFMNVEIESIKWWLLANIVSFVINWLVNFHLWQILAGEGQGSVVRLVFYNCSWSQPLPAPKLLLNDGLITSCELLFSSLVFFFFMSPLYWAAMVTLQCDRFRESVNCSIAQTDERPLGNFHVTSLDLFINRVQMSSNFPLSLFGINVTKVLLSVTGLMTTVQVVLSIVTKKLLPS